MDRLNNDIPTGIKAALSNPMLESAIKQQEMIQRVINPPIMNALIAQQSIVARQTALQSALSVSEMVSRSVAPMANSLADEAARAIRASLPRFDSLTASLTESIRAFQISMPKIDYLADAMRSIATSSLQGMTDAIIPMAEQMSKITQGFADAFRFQIPELVKTIPPFDFSAFSHLSETFSHIRDFEEKNDLLKSFGWFLISELPDEIVDTIYEQKMKLLKKKLMH